METRELEAALALPADLAESGTWCLWWPEDGLGLMG